MPYNIYDYEGEIKMFIFYGCSYTYGQGLQYYWLVENTDNEWKDMNKFLGSVVSQEQLPFESEQYRIQHSYPHLVSKHFGVNYFNTSLNNGGDNSGMYNKVKLIHNFVNLTHVDYHIFQYTNPTRNIDDVNNVDNVDELCYHQIERVNKCIDKYSSDSKWLAFSWTEEIGEILKERYPDNFIPIIYKNKEYVSFENLHELTINYQHPESGDRHFSDYGHSVIAESIIKKVQESQPTKMIKNIVEKK